jgi:hypothetical protein
MFQLLEVLFFMIGDLINPDLKNNFFYFLFQRKSCQGFEPLQDWERL